MFWADQNCLQYSRWSEIKITSLFFCGFPPDNGGLAYIAPMVIAQFARGTDDTVAWNQESHGIFTYGSPYRPASLRAIDTGSNVTIGGQTTHRDFEQRFPHFQLEVRSFQVQFYLLEFAPVLREDEEGVLLQFIHNLLILCIRKFAFQVVNAGRMIVRKFQATYAFISGCYEDFPERAFRKTVMDG